MASSSIPFRLKSYQTALAIVAPPQFRTEIDSLRKIHDKAYERWDPHINVLYPFVDPDQLGDAISAIRQRIADKDVGSFGLGLARPDKFVQKKAATVHLKPDLETEEKISLLRADLVSALGRDPKEGTHDGIFRAHMTVGQAGLIGPTLERLVEKVEKLAPSQWECRSLTVLKRQPSGKMVPVDDIWLQGGRREVLNRTEECGPPEYHWNSCNEYSSSVGWQPVLKDKVSRGQSDTTSTKVTIATYNLMTDSRAPAFTTRLTAIVDAIESATVQHSNVSILCLQEVNDEMLPLLLADRKICGLYPYSTHLPSSLLPSDRNLVTMASVPFHHNTIQFTERHKLALVIEVMELNVKVVNVHLSAGLSDDAVAAKKRQMDYLTEFCSNIITSREVVLSGDFNLTTSSSTIDMALALDLISTKTAQLVRNMINLDLWEDAFLASENMQTDGVIDDKSGATFDRIGNTLAAMSTSPINDHPQRYDRVLYRRNGRLKTEYVQLFGLADERGICGSDHYGLSATLHLDPMQNTVRDSLHLEISNVEKTIVIEDNTDLGHLLEHLLPTEDDRAERRHAIRLIEEGLSSGNGLTGLVLAPLGSYLLDTYFPESDVDLLAIGAVAPQVFFELAASRLQHLDSGRQEGVKGVHLVNSLVSIAELSVLGIKFDLQYCQAPLLLERCHSASQSTPLNELAFDKTLVSSLSPSSLRPFNTYRDTAYILNTVSDITAYRMAHRFLSLYLKGHGLYSAKFGYLGGIHLSLMLNRVVKLMEASRPSESGDQPRCSPATIVRTFFSYYANFDWALESVSDPTLTNEGQPARSPRDAVFIPAIHVPTARPNVASSCTPLRAQIFREEFNATSERLSREGWSLLLRPGVGVHDFLKSFPAYICLSLDVWGVDEIGGGKGREIVGALESKFPRLMLALGRLDGMYARVWPARFRNNEEKSLESDGTQFKGYYLIGVRMTGEHADLDAKKILRGKVIGVVRDFESIVKVSREFESGSCWLNTEFLAGKKIRDLNLVVDDRDWSAETGTDTISTDSNDHGTDMENVGPPDFVSRPNAEQPRRPNTTPLRMPHDIINRIKHDTAHFSAEKFLIGYEDRFEEKPREVELLKWKLEQMDEEFISLHRAVHIRRKDENGGEIVWDRRRRLDLIFGSGKKGERKGQS
ncbi:uncharacterized protein LY89DRAFT_732244 [Mollisia scopiformis]|uniref:polynucleotide adenylyltransferase n=1 Tax=Mollisia scopiformis TaxID=149040 RepID=A0A194XEW6_MOLSC|nr:uncharacterized protein LY89DRAFT_732244 [Mollisia scopiformis]KUJ18691.1 hypothetical protein LY89DRAFT_732244 [Mollisia scopiformis]